MRQTCIAAWRFMRYGRAIVRACRDTTSEELAHRAAVASVGFAGAIEEWDAIATQAIRQGSPMIRVGPIPERQWIGMN